MTRPTFVPLREVSVPEIALECLRDRFADVVALDKDSNLTRKSSNGTNRGIDGAFFCQPSGRKIAAKANLWLLLLGSNLLTFRVKV